MYKFSETSLERLATCHEDLQKLFNEVIKKVDCSIICGERGEAEQNEAYNNGFSKLKYPESKHNTHPSLAVDVMPYFHDEPHIRWEDKEACKTFARTVIDTAKQMGIAIEWGGNWKRFNDTPHFQLL